MNKLTLTTRLEKPPLVECLNCGVLTDRPIFCSRKCTQRHFDKKRGTKRGDRPPTTCAFCGIPKPGHKKYCNECFITYKDDIAAVNAKRRKDKRTELRNGILSLRGTECAICKYNKHPEALEFHHLNPLEKDKNVTSMGNRFEMERELAKCVLICANCHRCVHAGLYPEYLISQESL